MKTNLSRTLTLLMVLVVHLSFAQQRTITGTVTDEQGLPLPGVNIIIADTNTGVQTDFDGEFSIQASTGDELIFSFVGLTTTTLTVGEASRYDVTLTADAGQLGEVVVTALGVRSAPRSLSYAVETVDAEEIEKTGETNLVNSLASKAAGVSVVSASGSVGGSF